MVAELICYISMPNQLIIWDTVQLNFNNLKFTYGLYSYTGHKCNGVLEGHGSVEFKDGHTYEVNSQFDDVVHTLTKFC